MIAATPNRGLVIWSFKQSAAICMLKPHAQTAECLAVARRSRDPSSVIFTGGSDGTLKRWQPSSDAPTSTYSCHETFAAHTGSVLALVYHAETDNIVTAGEDRILRWWPVFAVNSSDSQVDKELKGHTGRITGLVDAGHTVRASS